MGRMGERGLSHWGIEALSDWEERVVGAAKGGLGVGGEIWGRAFERAGGREAERFLGDRGGPWDGKVGDAA